MTRMIMGRLVLLVSVLSATTSCSLKTERAGTVGTLKITLEEHTQSLIESTPLSAFLKMASSSDPVRISTPTTISDFDCFAVNVTGPGVPSRSEELVGCESPDNMHGTGVGILSDIFPRGQNILLQIPAGTKRQIDVYGVYPSFCTGGGSSGGAGSEDSGSGYHLGGVNQDLDTDDAVTIPIAYAGQAASLTCYGDHQGQGFDVQGIFPYGGRNDGNGWTTTISGQGFSTGATVTIGGANCPVTTRTENSLTCTVPAGSAGPANVVITNGPGEQRTLNYFQYVGAATPFISAAFNTNGIDFGNVAVSGGTIDFTLKFANMGDTAEGATETISGTHGADWTFIAGTCATGGGTLNAGATCETTLRFDPSATGARSANFSYFALTGIPLSGTGF